MSTGTDFQNRIRLALGKFARHTRLLRNNRGWGWVGDVVKDDKSGAYRTVTLHNARFIQFGLANGAGDLIGPTTITVTPEMVGRRLAIFTSLECKFGSSRPSEDQTKWNDFVLAAGGIAGVVRSEEEALKLVGETPA